MMLHANRGEGAPRGWTPGLAAAVFAGCVCPEPGHCGRAGLVGVWPLWALYLTISRNML